MRFGPLKYQILQCDSGKNNKYLDKIEGEGGGGRSGSLTQQFTVAFFCFFFP
jgi:hypothetical protein